MGKADGRVKEANSVRLSFRSTPSLYGKIMAIAKIRGWLNAQGEANVSKVLNYAIDAFDLAKDARKKQREDKRNGQRKKQ